METYGCFVVKESVLTVITNRARESDKFTALGRGIHTLFSISDRKQVENL